MSENDIITEMYGDPFSISGTNVEVILSLLSWGKKIASTKHVELTLEGCRCFEAQFSPSHSLSLPHIKTINGKIIWLHPT